MVGRSVIVLGLQPRGSLTLATAERHVAECRSQRRHKILCCECDPQHPPSEKADIMKQAYHRALRALELHQEAVVGIGLHSETIRLAEGNRITPIRMVGAALVTRNDLANPIILAASHDTEVAVRLVKQALVTWGGDGRNGIPVGSAPLLNKIAKRASAR